MGDVEREEVAEEADEVRLCVLGVVAIAVVLKLVVVVVVVVIE